jgi:chromosome segregation ATPase
MSLLPGVFLTTGCDKVKVLSGKIAKQTMEIENCKNELLTKKWECDLQANQIAAHKVELGNLRLQMEKKTDDLRMKVELVNSLRIEAQTSAQKYQWEIKAVDKKIKELSGALQAKSKELEDKLVEMSKLSFKHASLKTAMEIAQEKLREERAKITELSLKLDAVISNHDLEMRNMQTSLLTMSSELSEQCQISDNLRNDIKEKSMKIEDQTKRVQHQEAEISTQVLEIKSLEAEVTTNAQDLVQQITTIKKLREDVKEKGELLREQNKKIEENAREIQRRVQQLKELEEDIQKKAELLWKQDKQIVDNDLEIQKLTKLLRELQDDKQAKTKTISDLESNIKDHVKNLREQDATIASRDQEIKDLRLEVEAKNSDIKTKEEKIANLMRDLRNITKRREYQLRAIEKIKKSKEEKRLIILEKDALLEKQRSQLEDLKARSDEDLTKIMASKSDEIDSMKKEMQVFMTRYGKDCIEHPGGKV